MGKFLLALFTNRSSSLFVARLGSKLLLAKYGIIGPLADFVSIFIRAFVGLFIDSGIYVVDVTSDAIIAAVKIPEFRKLALKEYAKARRKGLTDAEKKQIRKEYLDTLDRFTRLRMQFDADPQRGIHPGNPV